MFLENLRANCGLQTDAEWRRFVFRWAGVSLLLIAVASYFSYGFFQFDEYYQVTEFVSYKLGKTPAGEMAWEFHQQIRPWFQPAVYYCAAKACLAVGIENPFRMSWVFRILSGLLSWTAIVAMMLAARTFLSERDHRRAAVVLLALLWMIPYLAVRTSSEAASGNLLAIGIAALVCGSAAIDSERRRFSIGAALTAGLCFGLAFECRFQIAFAVVGVVGWMMFVAAENWRRGLATAGWMMLGVAAPIALGTLIDHWGYGNWTIVPWQYFKVNILEHRADDFGTAPAWYYFYMVNEHFQAPITLLWTAAALVTWVRRPRHIITWTTLPFILVHCLVAHKEVRFLFPIVMPATLFFLLAVAPGAGGAVPAWLAWFWERRFRWPAKLCYALNLIALASACLTAKRPGVDLQQYIYDHYGEGAQVFLLGKKDPYQNVGVNMFFYRPAGFVYTKLDDFDALKRVVEHGPERFLLITDQISLASKQSEIVPRATLAYRSYPSWMERYNYFHWLDRSRTFSMYEVDRGLRTNSDAEPSVRTATRTHESN